MCTKLKIKIPERRHWRHFGIFIANFVHVSYVFSRASIVDFEQVNICWEEMNGSKYSSKNPVISNNLTFTNPFVASSYI